MSLLLGKDKTVTFTGHRPNGLGFEKGKAYRYETYAPFLPWLDKTLETFIEEGFRNFVTGGAQGFDQMVFWSVQRLKKKYKDIKNIVFVPFKGQETRWAKTGVFSQKEYKEMLQQADDIVFCSQLDDSATYFQIVNALKKRNECMLNASKRLCGLWSRPELQAGSLNRGGTYNCWTRAQKKKLETVRLCYDIQNGTMVGISDI